MMHGLGGLGFGGLTMGLMGIVPLLLIGLVVWLVIEATRRRDRADEARAVYSSSPPQSASSSLDAGETRGGSSGSRALAILEERYARGELDREEYLQRRRDLEG